MTDNETTEMWREHRKAGQAKRASNREHATQVLERNNIPFESKNGGAHLIVESGLGKIDFWPGTGLFIPRLTGKRGRGVRNLVKFCVQASLPQTGVDVPEEPNPTIIDVDLTEIEQRLTAHIEQEAKDDRNKNTTRPGPDHACKPDVRTLDDIPDPDDVPELPWD